MPCRGGSTLGTAGRKEQTASRGKAAEENLFLSCFYALLLGVSVTFNHSFNLTKVQEGNRGQPQGVIKGYLIKVKTALKKLTRDGEASQG